jgi:hypothetical protein
VNPQLSYGIAQARQQDLHWASEKARMARTVSGQSRFATLRRGLRNLGISHPRPRTTVGASRPAADGLT